MRRKDIWTFAGLHVSEAIVVNHKTMFGFHYCKAWSHRSVDEWHLDIDEDGRHHRLAFVPDNHYDSQQ